MTDYRFFLADILKISTNTPFKAEAMKHAHNYVKFQIDMMSIDALNESHGKFQEFADDCIMKEDNERQEYLEDKLFKLNRLFGI